MGGPNYVRWRMQDARRLPMIVEDRRKATERPLGQVVGDGGSFRSPPGRPASSLLVSATRRRIPRSQAGVPSRPDCLARRRPQLAEGGPSPDAAPGRRRHSECQYPGPACRDVTDARVVVAATGWVVLWTAGASRIGFLVPARRAIDRPGARWVRPRGRLGRFWRGLRPGCRLCRGLGGRVRRRLGGRLDRWLQSRLRGRRHRGLRGGLRRRRWGRFRRRGCRPARSRPRRWVGSGTRRRGRGRSRCRLGGRRLRAHRSRRHARRQ